MTHTLRLSLIALTAALVTGCDEEPLTTCAQAEAAGPSLESGTGVERFEPLADGDVLQASFGMQGGHHIYVGLRATGIDPGERHIPNSTPFVGWDAWAGDTLIGSGTLHQELTQEGDAYVVYGEMVILSYSKVEPYLDPETREADIRLVTSLSDSCGTNLTEELAVTLKY